MKNKEKIQSANVSVIIALIGLLGTIIAATIGYIGFSPELVSLISSPTPTFPTLTNTSHLEKSSIKFSVLVAPDKFVQNDPSTLQNFLDQAEKHFRQLKPRIGFVLTTGYGKTSTEGQIIAEIANRTLIESTPDLFSETIMKSFSSIADENNPPGTIEFEIYFFFTQAP